MKTLGLIGGLTADATAAYYKIINAEVRAHLGGSHSAKLLIHSLDYSEMYDLTAAGRWDTFKTVLLDAANGLVNAGAEAIVICSNTPHKLADDIEAQLNVPFLHIADFTGQALLDNGLKSAALLGTETTMDGDFFVGRLKQKFGIDLVVPNAADRAAIDSNIFEELSTMDITDATRALYDKVIKTLLNGGAKAVVLACTELQFVIKLDEVSVPLFDTLELHAKGAARWMLEE